MNRRVIVPLGAVAVAAAGVFAAVGIAGGGSDAPNAASLIDGYGSAGAGTLHRVATPSAGTNAASLAQASGKATKPKIEFFETAPFPIADSEALGSTLACPGKRRVLSGYFGADGNDVALTFSAPLTNRRWFVGATNLPGDFNPPTPATQMFAGIVCAKGVR